MKKVTFKMKADTYPVGRFLNGHGQTSADACWPTGSADKYQTCLIQASRRLSWNWHKNRPIIESILTPIQRKSVYGYGPLEIEERALFPFTILPVQED